mgnify:CR=1 FL=1
MICWFGPIGQSWPHHGQIHFYSILSLSLSLSLYMRSICLVSLFATYIHIVLYRNTFCRSFHGVINITHWFLFVVLDAIIPKELVFCVDSRDGQSFLVRSLEHNITHLYVVENGTNWQEGNKKSLLTSDQQMGSYLPNENFNHNNRALWKC